MISYLEQTYGKRMATRIQAARRLYRQDTEVSLGRYNGHEYILRLTSVSFEVVPLGLPETKIGELI